MPIRVIDTLKPKNDADFSIVEDIDVKGGFQTVANAAARNAITANHRKAGMFVVTQDDGKVWKLDADLTTWAEFTGGGGGGTLAGDVSGPSTNNTLSAINAIPLDTSTSLAGRYLSRYTRMWASAPLVDLCWDTNSNHLWVLQSNGMVHRINPATDTVIASINTSVYLTGAERIVFTGSHVVISGTLTGSSSPVVWIDAVTNTISGTLQGTPGMTGAVPAMTTSPGVLWIGWYDTTAGVANVDAYGPGNTTIGLAFQPSLQQIPLASTARPRDMSMLQFGSYVYIASEESVDRFDTGGFTLQTFALGVGEKASAILIAPSESDLWVAGGNKVYRFDPATFPAPGSLLATITVTGATDLRGLTRDSSGYIWTIDKATDGQVHVIDPSTNTVFASTPTLTADTPTEIIWNGASSIWVTAESASGPYGRGLREYNMSAQTYTRDFGNVDKYLFVEPSAASGAAGGDLAGTYPNPTLSKIHTRPLLAFTGALNGDHLAVERLEWENGGTSDVIWDGVDLWTGHWAPYVVRHNPATPTVTAIIDLSSYMAWVNNIFSYGSYICALGRFQDSGDGAVIIDKTTNGVVAFIRAPAGISSSQTAIGLYGTTVWIAYRDTAPGGNTYIRSYDLTAAIAAFPTPYTAHINSFTLPQSTRPMHMCAVGSGLWMAGADSLVQIDTAGPTVTSFSTSFWCSAVMFDGTSELWASGDDKVVRINMALFPAVGTEAAVVTVPGANSIEGLATDGTWIYAAEYDTVASIYRINAGVGTEAYDSTIAIRAGDEPYRLAYDGTRLWAGLDASDDNTYGLSKVVSGTYVENYGNIFNVKFGPSILRTNELNVGTTGAYSKVTRVATAPAPGDAGTQGDLRIVSNTGAAASLYAYHNGAWAPVGSSGAVAVGDNGRAKRAVAWKKAGAFGGRENSFTSSEESGAFSYNASTGISMSTGTGTVSAMYAMALLGPNLYFSGSTAGNVGRLYRINIATKTVTLVSGTNFSATGQLSGTSTHGAGAISADNMCDIVAHRNWLNGDSLACLTPKGLFLVHPTAYTGSYPATLFRGKPSTSEGFLGGRVVTVDDDSTNTNHMGLVIATAPNEGNVYFADWNNNIGATFPAQAIGTNPEAICVDANSKVWIVDRSNGFIFKCSVSPSAALLTVDDTITTVANARDIIWNGRHIVVLSVNPTNALTLLNPDDGSIVLQKTSPISPAAGTKWTFNGAALGADGAPRLWWDGVSIWGFSNGTSDVMRFDPDTLEVMTASTASSTSNGFCAVSEGVSLYTSPSAITISSVTSDLDGNVSFHSIFRLDTALQPSNGGTGLKTVGASGTVLTSNGPTVTPSWQSVTIPTPEINTGDNNLGTRTVGHAGQKQATGQRRMAQFVNAGTSNAVSMAWTGDDILTAEAGFIRSYDATTLVARGTYDAATAISITPLHVIFGGSDRRSAAHDPCAWAGGTGGLFKLRYLSGALTLEGSAYTTNMSVGGLIYDGSYLWILNTSQNCISRVDNPNEDGVGPTVTLNWTAASSLTTNAGANTRQRMAWDGRYLWTISQSDSKLYKIDTQTSGSVTSYTLAGTPTAIAFDGKWLWIPIGTTMYRIDPSSSTPVTSPVTYNMNSVPTGSGTAIGAVHYIVPDGRWLWLLNNTLSAAGYGVVKFDPTTGAQLSMTAAVNAPVCAVVVGHGDSGYILVSATSTISHYGFADSPTMVLGGLKMRGPVIEHATRVTSTPYTIGVNGTPVGANYITESGASEITLPTIGGFNQFANGLTITVKNISGAGVTVVAGGTDAAEWGASPTTTPVANGAVKRFMWWYNGISGQWLIMS